MKDLKNKVVKTTKRVVLSTIDGVATPLHMVVIGSGDLVQAATSMIGNGIANAEGYLVHKIDGSRDKVEVAKLRKETTDMAFIAVGHSIKVKSDNLRAFLAQSKKDVKDGIAIIKSEVKQLVQPADDSHNDFDIAHLRKQRADVLADKSLSDDEKGKQVRAINKKIGIKNKQVPTASPAEAFAPAGS